jgi:tRNA(Ile)-lysidine synthase
MYLLNRFRSYITQQHLFHPKDKLLLAVSGGVDSVALFELCRLAGYDIAIAHCNFKLRAADSERDEAFVTALAKKYALPFFTTRFDTTVSAATAKKSIEETARDLRYAWFEQTRQENNYDYIVTAHHANDNIETLLMNFFRGTGIKGLHGILPKQGKIIRPLLFTNKKMIEQFAKERALEFVLDYTNAQNDFTRNYFRNELVPAIQKVFPAVEDNLLKNIERFNEAEQLYQQSVSLHKKKLLEIKDNEIHISLLKLQQTIPLSTIVYEIIKDYNFTAHQTEEVIDLLKSESGKYIRSSTHRIFKNRKWLIIAPNQTGEAANILIEANDKTIIFEGGLLQIESVLQPSAIYQQSSIAQLDAADIQFPLLLRKWKAGDYFYPLGMNRKKKLGRFFTDQKLSLTQKENIWVIESHKKILWVIGMRIDDRFKITRSTKKIVQFTFQT